MDCDSIRLLLLLGTIGVYIQTAFGSATFSVRFIHYTNPGGLGSNGHCCDGRAGFCLTPCDHMFTTCFDHSTSWRTDVNVCPHGKKQSGRILNQDSITFGNIFGGIRNPMVFRFEMWPGSVKMKVQVWDYDAMGRWDDVDYLQKTLTLNPATAASKAKAESTVLQSRTSLTIELKLYCDPHFYGPNCAVYCASRDSYEGHYTCDEKTGGKICKQGWTGVDCNLPFNECGSFPCMNGGRCTDKHNAFSCKCLPGYTGDRCEIDINECEHKPCLNGGVCQDGVNNYTCVCDEGYGGINCENILPPCHSSPCQNNGTCHDVNSTEYNCTCMEGFSGDDCQYRVIDEDAVPPGSAQPRESFGLPVSVVGHLKQDDELAIKDWVKVKMEETGKVGGKALDISVRLMPCTGDNGVIVTEVFMLIHYSSNQLTLDSVEYIMSNLNRAIKYHFIYKRYTGQECNAGFLGERKSEQENSWIAANWLVLALLALAVMVIAAVIVGVIFFRKRRRLQHRRRNNSERPMIYDSVNDFSPGAGPVKHMTDDEITQSFGNALYFEPKDSPDHAPDSAFDEDEDPEGFYTSID